MSSYYYIFVLSWRGVLRGTIYARIPADNQPVLIFFPCHFFQFFFKASIPSRQPAGAHLFSFSTLFISFFPLFFYFFGNAWIPVNTPAGAKYMSSYYYCTFVLILATTICVSAYFYICVTHLDYAASLLVLIDD